MTLSKLRARPVVTLLIPLLLIGGVALAQQEAAPVPDQVPSGAVLPRNLNELGSMMRDRVGDLISEEAGRLGVEEPRDGTALDLFTGGQDEDPNLAEIRRIARDLETQQSLIVKLADLQGDLIDFATRDPHAAYRSRVPVRVCEMAIEDFFCRNLTGSFR